VNHNTLRQTTFRAGLLQSQAYRSLTNFMNTQLAHFDVSLPEWSALGVLVLAEKPLRPHDIATTLAIKQPVATRLLQRLVVKGLVSRSVDSSDGRATLIHLTKQGLATAQVIERELRQEMKLFLAGIKSQELAIYLKVMEQIADKK
jgi:MarR family transcriptional regulator for hemolysin